MKILLLITSSISSYKTPSLVRMFKNKGHSVVCSATKNALKLVAKKSLETVSENPVITNMWREKDPLKHINVNNDTEVLLIAPATANIIGKIANGICDDNASTIAAAYKGIKIFAPAMNPEMWKNPAIQKNVKYMTDVLGYILINPEAGVMACNDEGVGRLATLEKIVDIVVGQKNNLKNTKNYKDINFLITAGSTREWIDPIRYITNSSSGRMGVALFNEVSNNSGNTTYIEGLVDFEANTSLYSQKKITVDTTEDMKDAVISSLKNTDIVIMAAAALDFKPKKYFDKKIKKQAIENIELETTVDIIATAKKSANHSTLLVAFAAESADTDDELENFAIGKMEKKGVDMIVGNRIEDAIGKPTNIITIFFKNKAKQKYSVMSKEECAKIIVEEAVKLWKEKNN